VTDRHAPGARTLAAVFDPHRNSLAVLRLGLAALVAVAHALSVGFGYQPHIGRTALSDLAVDGFFVISGFLVAGSWSRLRSLPRFAWHRFLRIMPGFWVCLLVTATVVAPLAAVLSGQGPLMVFSSAQDPAWRYLAVNAALPMLQYEIAGISTPAGETVFDGSLWTLQYEAFCYGVLGALGALSILRRRWVVIAALATAWLFVLLDSGGLLPIDVPVFTNQELSRFLLVFLLGAAGHVLADRVLVDGRWAVAAAINVLTALFLVGDYRLVGAVGFAYLCLYAVVRLPCRFVPAWDLSYGLYVYHWPVQFLLAMAGAAAWGEWVFLPVSLLVTLCLALVSWVVVESPALRLKGMPMPGWAAARP
jgi:peptidoglycan/LPS O-acetylase OafA/YrhL